MGQGRIRDTGGHQRNDGDDTLRLYVNCFLIPHLAKKHVIVEMCEHRGEFSQLVPSGSLYDFLSHFFVLPYFPIFWSPVDQTCFSFAAAGLFCAMTPASGCGT